MKHVDSLDHQPQGSWVSRLFVWTRLLHPDVVMRLLAVHHKLTHAARKVAQAKSSLFPQLQPRSRDKGKMLFTGVWGQTQHAFTVCWHTLGSCVGHSRQTGCWHVCQLPLHAERNQSEILKHETKAPEKKNNREWTLMLLLLCKLELKQLVKGRIEGFV